MSHTEKISAQIANASHSDPLKLSGLYVSKIYMAIVETPVTYDATDPRDQPHVFSKNLDNWSNATKRIIQEKSDSRSALENSAHAILSWSAGRAAWNYKPENHIDIFARQGASDPLAASTAALVETRRRAETASRHAAREFYRMARHDRGTALAVLDEMSPHFEDQDSHLKDIFDPAKVRQSLIKHARPDDALHAKPKITKEIIPIPPGFF